MQVEECTGSGVYFAGHRCTHFIITRRRGLSSEERVAAQPPAAAAAPSPTTGRGGCADSTSRRPMNNAVAVGSVHTALYAN